MDEQQPPPPAGSLVRELTDDEAAFFAENGWVKLPGLVTPSTAAMRLRGLAPPASVVKSPPV